MKAFVAVALGGALGAVARYWVFLVSTHYLGHQFPYGTLFVNVLGSFAMGALLEVLALRGAVAAEIRLFLAVGVLGSFTTFSTFSLDVASLYERGRLAATVLYMGLSVTLSIGALFMGLALIRRVLI